MATYVKKCPECGGINLILNKDKGEVICRDCGLVIEEKLIDFGQEWREFDSDQSEKRRRTGAPMTYSVSKFEPIIIKKDNDVKIVKIGEFVDKLIENNDRVEIHGNLEILNVGGMDFEAVSFDDSYRIDFHMVSEVSRHYANEIYEVILGNGNKIEVTGSHSVFSLDNNLIVPIFVEELKKGDSILGPNLDTLHELLNSMVLNNTQLLIKRQKGFVSYKIKSIKIKPYNDFAYDLTVPGYENFVGGRGGIFLHNTKFDRGLGTDVGQKGDIFRLSGKGRNKFFRLRKWQHRISTAIERNLKLALAELKRVASYLKLPKSVEEEASRIYTLAVQRGLVRGRSMESVVAGSLYAACRRHEVPRTLDELSEASGIDKKEIGRTYRFVTRELGIRILPSNPIDYIPRFASALKLNPETQSKAVEILEMAENSELTSGRGPTGIAAASLYVAALICNEKKTQREVADIAGVTEVTIRNRYKELLKKLKLEDKIKKVKKEEPKKD